ncbi:hypothetical protein CC77DRAFT_709989 [Alternaria alternata]|uniref:Uncharacterized protein n=1 Tax=Alternaria alternata TaxID=5599 RepID=A0A177DUC0_ALTAL|nr:hypothetical protein CC77DRAFT_709989 [Alternaria alternata]OAG23334.1 hypothetical protein CC77DRAFT_709989 [Alternaria alternata]
MSVLQNLQGASAFCLVLQTSHSAFHVRVSLPQRNMSFGLVVCKRCHQMLYALSSRRCRLCTTGRSFVQGAVAPESTKTLVRPVCRGVEIKHQALTNTA